MLATSSSGSGRPTPRHSRALERAVSSRELETAFFRILKRFDVLPSNEHEREYHFLGEPERLAELAEFCRGGEFEIR